MISRLVYVFMPVSIILAFLWAPPAEILGQASRILYFHVPVAWVSVLAFLVSGIVSIIFLNDKNKRYAFLEEKAYISAVIGILFTVLTVITGSIWAKVSWGIYWNWDPRETSIVILFLIYVAYFCLRSALSGSEGRERISSAYLIMAMVMMPFFVFVIPRVTLSLHPDTIINAERKMHLDVRMRETLLATTVSFTLLYYYIYKLTLRSRVLEKKIEEKDNEF